jgi:beta-lactamase class A
VDGDELRLAASLIKLPAAMDLYRAAELGKVDLDKKITLQESWLDGGYGTLYQKGAGYELSLRDAAKIMLTESDNTALKAIAYSTETKLTPDQRAINALDADISQNPDLTVSIGARSYTSFLKCLYFSCYLSKDDSQELLDYLSESTFDNRLAAGIDDKSIRVAHKIGVANTTTQSDCGIVYVPNRNYAICIMLNGDDNPQTNKHIAELSKIVYTFVKTRK